MYDVNRDFYIETVAKATRVAFRRLVSGVIVEVAPAVVLEFRVRRRSPRAAGTATSSAHFDARG